MPPDKTSVRRLDAFFAIASHARKAEKTLGRIADARDRHPTMLANALGDLFSMSRNPLSERTSTIERAYRSTLLSLHHGFDLIMLFRAGAREEDDDQLVAWCDAWLTTRKPLVDRAVEAIDWFADHRELAMAGARDERKAASI